MCGSPHQVATMRERTEVFPGYRHSEQTGHDSPDLDLLTK
jgi:hypothetical protein